MSKSNLPVCLDKDDDKEIIKELFSSLDYASFEMMAKNLHLLIILLDTDLVLRFANKNFYELVGWSKNDVLNKDYVKQFIPPRLRLFVHSTVTAILAKKSTSYSGSNEVITRDRGVRYINWNAVHLCRENGETYGILCLGLDITNHHNLDDILNRVDLEKNLLLHAISEPVIYHDPDGRITWANRAFLEATNLNLDGVLGSHLRQVLEYPGEGSLKFAPLKLPGEPGHEEVVKLPDGHYWLSKSYPLRAQDVNPYQLMMILHPTDRCDEKKARLGQGSGLAGENDASRYAACKLGAGCDRILFHSKSMLEVQKLAQVIHQDRTIPVLIEGETGVGKEVIARYIHYGETGNEIPFVDINCAAITPTIFESELFGYEGGAFTGGRAGGQKGKIALADGGTLFLDEISEIPTSIQAKLLRVIQERDYYPVGGLGKRKADLRLICATNANLAECVEKGSFRKDLFYRLEAIRICIPPLRDRAEDIIPLAEMFLRNISKQKNKKFTSISPDAANILLNYPWPGNVRQLRNAIERVVVMWNEKELKPERLNFLETHKRGKTSQPEASVDSFNSRLALPSESLDLKEFNDKIIKQALARHGGNITQTAAYLKLSRRSLSYRLKQLDDDE